jgi:hypothetical protein
VGLESHGAAAGRAPGAICQSWSCHCIGSQCPYATDAVEAATASKRSRTQARTQSGPSVPLTWAATGVAVSTGSTDPAVAVRKARTLVVITH